ncbi:type I secretion system permease/ATPase [Microbulbifer sp. ANSA001]|uniref:type I secretion system permease/ATPase n=1 Tax=Microbulbifer sp. ANSA001 TaxID=3243358 RepID=UPI0040420546
MSENSSNVLRSLDESEGIKTDTMDFDPWCEAVTYVARLYRVECSPESIRISGQWDQNSPVDHTLRRMARQAGLTIKFCTLKDTDINPWRLPLVAQLRGGQIAVIETISSDLNVGFMLCGDQGLKSTLPLEKISKDIVSLIILRPRQTTRDTRIDDYIKTDNQHWLRKIILRDIKPYGHIMLATTVANTLALSGIIFSKQVYDRVIPAESIPTLYVLFSGVLVAIIFDFVMRSMRVKITDLLGKRADIRMSDLVFGHAVRIQAQARPKSTGTFISQIRELEKVREIFTSTTILAIADLPFFLLFLIVMWWIAGALALVPLLAVFLLLIPGLLLQPKLAKLSQESIKESSLRNAILIETIQGVEDIKSLQAEQYFQGQWNHFNTITADASLKLRSLVGMLLAWTHNVQSSVFAVIVLFGAPMVMSGTMTTGALVAASILGSRMMAPMANITKVLSRWQQAKFAMQGIDNLMQLPVDNPQLEKRVKKTSITGNFHFKNAVFQYGEEGQDPALIIPELKIYAGERVAILGKNGSGKSTFLHAMAGAIVTQRGQLQLDNVSIKHIDPADVRRDIGLLRQEATLFHGTIHENLTLGAPNANDEEILWALNMSGASNFVNKLPKGIGYLIQEGGFGLSGGQKQSLLLSRMLLRHPNVLLLDEPTAALDESTERKFIRNLQDWAAERTVVVATHRTNILTFAQRIIVLNNGYVVLDEPKEKALEVLTRSQRKTSTEGEKIS